jgi:putative ABC transport system permease protein
VVSAALIVVGISVLASLQPAAKASRLAPVDALRHI